MTTRTSPALKQAFKRFVELVKPIEDVQYVVAFDFDDEEPEISTYITKLDEEVAVQVFHAQDELIDHFPHLPVDFHIWYLEGNKLSDFVRHMPPLVYAREKNVV